VTQVTISLGVPRFGDRMASIGRGLTGRIAAASLVVLAILAGAATYAWMANLVPAYFGTRGWMTGLLVADLAIAMALMAMLVNWLGSLTVKVLRKYVVMYLALELLP